METQRRTWKLQDFVAHKANVNCLALGHKSNQVLATGGDDKKVNLWAIGRYSCLMSLSGHTTPVESVCFGHSEDLVCAGSQTGALKIWDLEAAKLLRTFTGHKGAIKCMDFHPYSDYLASGSTDSSIRLWDTRKRGCVVTYSSHRLAVNSLQFSPDGQWIASACEDGLVKVWDFRMGKVLKELSSHSASVSCVRFHPHELLLASCGADRQINFWDMERFALVSNYGKDGAPVKQIAFSDDGYCLLGCGEDGLSVIGFEPARILDRVTAHWPNIHDVTLAHNHLIVGSYHSTYVMLSVVDMTKVYPFGGTAMVNPPYAVNNSPFNKGQSLRKSFSKDRPCNQEVPKYVQEEKTIEESSTDDDSGAIIADYNHYKEIFRPSRSLNRTPPPCMSVPSSPTSDYPSESSDSRSPTRLRDITSPDSKKNKEVNFTESKPRHVPAAPEIRRKEQPQDNKFRLKDPPRGPGKDYNSPILPDKFRPKEFFEPTVVERATEVAQFVSMSALTVTGPGPLRPPGAPPSPAPGGIAPLAVNGHANNIKSSVSDTSLTSTPTVAAKSTAFVRANTDLARKPTRDCQIRRAVSPNVEIYERPMSRRAQENAIERPSLARFHSDEEKPTKRNGLDFEDSSSLEADLGVDLDDFLPKSTSSLSIGGRRSEMTDKEVIACIMRGHNVLMTVLTSRQRSLQIFHSMRVSKGLQGALESIIAINDSSVVVDILNVMANRPSLWNLDIVKLLLPKIHELLESKYESYNNCGAFTLKLVLRNFAPVIKSNALQPACTLGVDLSREDRFNKCMTIANQLETIRSFVERRVEAGGARTSIYRDLCNVFHQTLD